MRRARHKSSDPAFYHIITRVAGSPRYFPLRGREARRRLLETIRSYVNAYFCQMAAFIILGNHYHLILFFESFQTLSLTELRQRARLLYGRRFEEKTANWTIRDWSDFNRKLFDVSALMQHINGEYAKWFNRRYNRRGHLWGDRFKNPELLDRRALQECLFYVELNALRAGLVKRPEQWKASSARLRWKGSDQELIPLAEIFPGIQPEALFNFYRFELYQRGQVLPTNRREHQGNFLSRLRFFTDGLAIGSQQNVRHRLAQLRTQGFYRRRKHPVAQLSGFLYTVREQRSHAFT